MKQHIKILACFLFLCSPVLPFTACHKETVAPPPAVITPIIPPITTSPGEHIFDSLSFHFSYFLELWGIGGFGKLFGSIIMDSAYYSDHTQVFLKFAGDSAWKSVPYVPKNHVGQSSIYFVVDNINYFDGGRIVDPYMEILGRPAASVDFSLKVSVKVIISP